MSELVKFVVGITFCDGINSSKEFWVKNKYPNSTALREAVGEYAGLLGKAVEQDSRPHARHIRMTSLIGLDEAGEPMHHIHSGVFTCEHDQATSKADI